MRIDGGALWWVVNPLKNHWVDERSVRFKMNCQDGVNIRANVVPLRKQPEIPEISTGNFIANATLPSLFI